MTITRIRAIVLAAALAITAACSGPVPALAVAIRPADTPTITSVRIWRHVVDQPGELGLTIKTSGCMTNVYANAVYAKGNAIRTSRTVTARGTEFTLYIRFPRGTRTGRWYIADAFADPCHPVGFPLMWAGQDNDANAFNVHPARKG